MEEGQPDTLPIALILDEARERFEPAAAFLESLHRSLSPNPLSSTDIYLARPDTLVVLLHLAPRGLTPEVHREIVEGAQGVGFWLLNVSRLPADGMSTLLGERLSRCEVQYRDAHALQEPLNAIRVELAWLRETQQSAKVARLLLSSEAFARALPKILETRRVFVPSDSRPRPHAAVSVSLQVEGHPAMSLEGTVDGVEAKGYWARLTLGPAERHDLEGRLATAPAPRLLPRPSEVRYPAVLPVVLGPADGGPTEYTRNISRAGIFVATLRPPAAGSTVRLRIALPHGGQHLATDAKVVRVVTAEEGKANNLEPGVGLQFLAPGEDFQERLAPVIASLQERVGRKALIADDSPSVRSFVAHLLQSQGLKVLQAASGREAVQILIDELLGLQLMVLDLSMPDMSGFELLTWVRETGKHGELPIVVLTGTQGTADRALQMGADEVLLKGTPWQEMLARIDAVMMRRSAHDG